MSNRLDRRRGHSLMTAELREALPKLYSQEDNPDPTVVVKYFCPVSEAVWFITEFDGEDLMFGWADLGFGCGELGYISLSELSEAETSIRHLPIPAVERDLHWKPVPLSVATEGR